jgi:hypothetical protein
MLTCLLFLELCCQANIYWCLLPKTEWSLLLSNSIHSFPCYHSPFTLYLFRYFLAINMHSHLNYSNWLVSLPPKGQLLKIWKCDLLTTLFFVKSCVFLRTEINELPSNFTGNTKQCISIGWYPETSTFMLWAAVNATRSPKKRLTGVV